MKFLKILPVFILISILSLSSCLENSETNVIPGIPVDYNLTLDQRDLFDYYDTYPEIKFVDQNNAELIFERDTLFNITERTTDSEQRGEELQFRYRCLTSYHPNFSFVTSIEATEEESVDLKVVFGTGTYWNETGNDYKLSWFFINPYDSAGISYMDDGNRIIDYEYADSLVIRNETFYNVYSIKSQVTSHFDVSTISCYYSLTIGVVAFKNEDDRFFVREL